MHGHMNVKTSSLFKPGTTVFSILPIDRNPNTKVHDLQCQERHIRALTLTRHLEYPAT